MTREVIYHLLEEAAESGRHYQSGLMAARRTASAHGGCTEFNILGDALMEADNAIAAIEEMRGCRTSASDCLEDAQAFLDTLRELRSKANSVVDGFAEIKSIDEAISEAEWSLDILRCAARGHSRRRRTRTERKEE